MVLALIDIGMKLLPMAAGAAFAWAALSALGHFKTAKQLVGKGRRYELHNAYEASCAALAIAIVEAVLYPFVLKVAIGVIVLVLAIAPVYLNLVWKPRHRDRASRSEGPHS
jgi:Flp pilus assembly protein TadB